MKTLYFDCGMGAAGDMLMASLYEICPDKERFLKMMNEMGLPGLSGVYPLLLLQALMRWHVSDVCPSRSFSP